MVVVVLPTPPFWLASEMILPTVAPPLSTKRSGDESLCGRRDSTPPPAFDSSRLGINTGRETSKERLVAFALSGKPGHARHIAAARLFAGGTIGRLGGVERRPDFRPGSGRARPGIPHRA